MYRPQPVPETGILRIDISAPKRNVGDIRYNGKFLCINRSVVNFHGHIKRLI